MLNNCYVYLLIDPRTGLPFYVGEGKGNRAWSHLTFNSGCHNPHKDRIIRKIQSLGLEVIVKIVNDGLSKSASQEFEEILIEEIGISNLSNICPNANPPILIGADNGFYGKTHTDENKKKCGNANRGRNTKTESGSKSIANSMTKRWKDPVQRENQLTALRARKGEKRSPEAIESYKRSAALRDANMTSEERSARTLAGVATKKIKYAGLKRQAYIDDAGKKRFKYVSID
jgi:hypothetical protein